MRQARIGIWLIGAKGNVAAGTTLGLAALRRGLTGQLGLVSALEQFRQLGLADWEQFVVGGHEIRQLSLADAAGRLASQSRAIDPQLIRQCAAELEQADRQIRLGTVYKVGRTIEQLACRAVPRRESPRQAIDRLKKDIARFAKLERLSHVIVVNVASTEPAVDPRRIPPSWTELEPLLDRPRKCPLPASSLYAIAALELGFSYINFTPSLGSAPKAIDQLARLRNTRHMGCDGKTGETLVKSALAPMFQKRNLRVMSWVGHNIFGNMDGKVLDDPLNKASKQATKDHLLARILGYRPQTRVSIEFVESLGDWKTAWDHVHFAGFLGAPMTFQFIWQGCDSLLAAPLVLDLVRFTELAWRRGHVGHLTFLASFFKNPYGVEQQGFERQFQMLESWAAGQQQSASSALARPQVDG